MPYYGGAGDWRRLRRRRRSSKGDLASSVLGIFAGGVAPPAGQPDWFDKLSNSMADVGTKIIPPIVNTVFGAFGAGAADAAIGAATAIVPPAASGLVDTVQPYVGGMNFGSVVPGVVTQTNPAPTATVPVYNDNTTFVNPPDSSESMLGGYSSASYQMRTRRRRGSYRIMRRRRRYY